MSEVKSKYAALLNALDEMQMSPAYAVRKMVLFEAERTIVGLEQRLASFAPAWSQERPVKEGWYWWKPDAYPAPTMVYVMTVLDPTVFYLSGVKLSLNSHNDGSWAGPIVPPEGTR
jgi:hypothetical protein